MTKYLTPSAVFIVSSVVVNAANYGFNLILGRFLGPDLYADAVFYTTLALAFSFVALMFQMTATRFIALNSDDAVLNLQIRAYLNRLSLFLGLGFGAFLVLGASFIQRYFHIQNAYPIVLLGISLPFYFLMSVGRGVEQGQLHFKRLTITYQIELWAKVIFTFLLLYLGFQASSVALATVISFFAALAFCYNFTFGYSLSENTRKDIFSFFVSVGIYEFSQILINNSDVLLSKSFLATSVAGQYAALAMIGRIVFFSSFPVVMVVIPTIITKIKNNEPYQKLFYGSIIACLSIICIIILGCYAFDTLIMEVLFGSAFLSVSSYLWQYAIATGLFTLCNIFIYYHLSLNQRFGVWLSIAAGLLQIALIFFQHTEIQDFINAQIISMGLLLVSILGFHFFKARK
jgi:O-antigen/teichoic acid export membrane protein